MQEPRVPNVEKRARFEPTGQERGQAGPIPPIWFRFGNTNPRTALTARTLVPASDVTRQGFSKPHELLPDFLVQAIGTVLSYYRDRERALRPRSSFEQRPTGSASLENRLRIRITLLRSLL